MDESDWEEPRRASFCLFMGFCSVLESYRQDLHRQGMEHVGPRVTSRLTPRSTGATPDRDRFPIHEDNMSLSS